MKKEEKITIALVLVLVVALIALMIYTFSLRPSISGHIVDAQTEGYQYAISQIIDKASTCQEVQLISGNRVMNLIAVDCLE